MSTSISEDEYKPAFLTNVNRSIDPSAVSFLQDQVQNVNTENYLHPVTTVRSASTQGGIQQVNFSTSLTSQISRESIKAVSSSRYHMNDSAAMIPSNRFNGDTVYGSVPPARDIQFQTNSQPAHLGTVSAHLCVPSLSSQSHLVDNSRTVIATPFFGNSATFPTFPVNPYSYNYSYPVPESIFCNAFSGYQVPSMPSFSQQFHTNNASSFDEFYRNDQSIVYQFPEAAEPTEYKAEPTPIGAAIRTDINELIVHPSTIVLPTKSKSRKEAKSIKNDPEITQNTDTGKQKRRKRGKAKVSSCALEDELLSSQGRQESELPKTLPKKKKKTSSPGGIAPTDPDARRRKENMAFEKGCFIFRISDLESSDEPVNFVWFVENYQLLQKYVLKTSDVFGCYEYFRTERYSGWLADEPWLYYPAKVDAFFDESDETERVTINCMPTKDEIDQYRNEEFNKKDELRRKMIPEDFKET